MSPVYTHSFFPNPAACSDRVELSIIHRLGRKSVNLISAEFEHENILPFVIPCFPTPRCVGLYDALRLLKGEVRARPTVPRFIQREAFECHFGIRVDYEFGSSHQILHKLHYTSSTDAGASLKGSVAKLLLLHTEVSPALLATQIFLSLRGVIYLLSRSSGDKYIKYISLLVSWFYMTTRDSDSTDVLNRKMM